MSLSVSDSGPALVRFAQRQTRGLLMGLSGLRAAALGVGIFVFVAGLLIGGAGGCALASPLWAMAVAVAFVRWNGRPVVEALPVAIHWEVRSKAAQTRYLRRVSAVRPVGTMALPGDAAPLRFFVDPAGGVAMIHDPHRSTLSAVISVTHPAYVLLAPEDRAARVSGWSRALAALGASNTVAAVQVLEATLPDPGHEVRSWWANHGIHDDGWSDRQYSDLMDQSVGSSTHRTTVTVSVDLRKAARQVRDAGRGMTGGAAVLRSVMTSFEASLRAASLQTAGWLTPEALAVLIRQAYDPAANDLGVGSSGANLTSAGPVAVEEHWNYLRHDSGYSSVLWISEWPRIEVPPHFLHALVFTPEVRRTLSMVVRPLSTADALRQIRREKVEYVTDAAQKARIGQLADLSDEQQYSDVLDRERALISGHSDLQYSGFVVVTASGRDELAAAVGAIERSAIQCGCETRPLFGQQAQAFTVAALPLGRGVY